jgi:hypothetical protein
MRVRSEVQGSKPCTVALSAACITGKKSGQRNVKRGARIMPAVTWRSHVSLKSGKGDKKMRSKALLTLAATLLAVTPVRAEFRQINLTTFGMD